MRLPEQAGPVIRVPMPVKREIGLGDALRGITERFGLAPCGGCRHRAEVLNRWLTFAPPRWGRE